MRTNGSLQPSSTVVTKLFIFVRKSGDLNHDGGGIQSYASTAESERIRVDVGVLRVSAGAGDPTGQHAQGHSRLFTLASSRNCATKPPWPRMAAPRDVTTMSIKEMKEEIALLGSTAEGVCVCLGVGVCRTLYIAIHSDCIDRQVCISRWILHNQSTNTARRNSKQHA